MAIADASLDRPFIGRHRELNLILERLKAARACSAGVVFVRGEAGIGKSRLLSEVAKQASILGHRVLTGRADEFDFLVPYASLRDALGDAISKDPPPAIRRLIEEAQRHLDVSATSRGEGASNPVQAIRYAYGAWERLLRHWCQQDPVVLMLDDIHVADEDTLAILSMLARSLPHLRCAVLASVRAHIPDVDAEHIVFVQRLVSEGLAMVVNLEPLDLEETRAVAAAELGGPLDTELALALWSASRGNPFYLRETIGAYADLGVIAVTHGLHRLTGERPPVVSSQAATTLARIERLGASIAKVAKIATQLPKLNFERLHVIADLSGMTTQEVGLAVDDLVRANVLCQAGSEFEFVHPIVRDTLAATIGSAERRLMHEELAQRLRSIREAGGPVDPLELAAHVGECASVHDPQAASILTEAGDSTIGSAPRSAAVWYEKALAVTDESDSIHAILLAKHSQALMRSSRLNNAVSSGLQALPKLSPGPLLEDTAAGVASMLATLGHLTEGIAVLDAAIAPDRPSPRLLLQRGLLRIYSDQLEEAERDIRLGVELGAGDFGLRAIGLGELAGLAFVRGRISLMQAEFARQSEALRQATAIERIVALAHRSLRLAQAGLTAKAEAALAEATALWDSSGGGMPSGEMNDAGIYIDWQTGRWDEAVDRIARAEQYVAISEQGPSIVRARTAIQLDILVHRACYREARELAAEIRGRTVQPSVARWSEAQLLSATGKLDEARELLEAAWESDQSVGRMTSCHRILLSLTEVELQAGHRDRAIELVRELQRHAARSDWTAVRQASLFAHSLTYGDPETARAALALATDSNLPFWVGRISLWLGQLGCEPKDNLERSLATFKALGAERWIRATVSTFRVAHLPIPRQPRRRPGTLSDTDRQLVRLVAEGLSNRRIAEALHLSPKTVEVYLSRIYSRTGVSSRFELALAVFKGELLN